MARLMDDVLPRLHSFLTTLASDRMPTAKPTRSDATRRCHSICS